MSNLSLIRQKYLEYFRQLHTAAGQDFSHAIVPSVNLVPENDPTTLFTSAGMQPMIPYFFGEPHPLGKRIANSQKCFRAEDIEEVGDNRHTTFFEMLGNWSLGDYFKKEQIAFFFRFLTEEIGLDPRRLYVTVFAGNKQLGIPRDDEAAATWQKLFAEAGVEAKIVENPEKGLQEGRIFFYPEKKNWWSRSGVPDKMPVGEPGGPDSEVFYDFGSLPAFAEIHEHSLWADQPCHVNCDCGRFLEIGNSVFMQYQRSEQGFEPLKQQNIDFGGGLERILAAFENQPDIFQTDAFLPIIRSLAGLANSTYAEQPAAYRIVADHLRASVMLIHDGVLPSGKEQGYVLRRLLRRAMRQGQMLGIDGNFTSQLVPSVIEIYADFYQELSAKAAEIADIIDQEEKKFRQSMQRGLREFEKMIVGKDQLTAELAFKLYESYGFPFELSIEEAKSRQLDLEVGLEEKIAERRQAHAALSRSASEQKFKGGLADQGELTTRFHTATHLLHAALRQILGEAVGQKGSNITAERLRFDFSFPRALSEAEKIAVEDQVNAWIKADLPVTRQEMPKTEALKSGAIAFFLEKYPERVSVYTVGQQPDGQKGKDWISKEFCGGPHVTHTGEIGKIHIFKEKAAAAGVRRIYATFA